ncbi:hypothetical protein J1614_006823 [Plenodomus biglobosus]|nr:hypothetical protein J1614_006823 [Plenodomus biglobosus]
MPQKFPWSKSNRSHNSVDISPSGQPSAVGSALAVNNNDVAAQRFPPTDGQPGGSAHPAQHPSAPQQPQQQQQQQPPPASQGPYREQYPQRAASQSQAHRLSAHLPLGHAPPNFQQQAGPSQPGDESDPAHRGSYQPAPAPPAVHTPEPKKQSLSSRIAAGVRGHKKDDAAKQAQKNGVARSKSVRTSDARSPDYPPSQEGHRLQGSQQWHPRQESSPHLPTSNEQDEDNLDPFLQQDGRATPQVPPKDVPYQQQHAQYSSNPHQEQYGRPPLDRVSTEGSYQTQGGVEQHYSPDQHQAQGLQQQQQQQQQTKQQQPQQQYQGYQPPLQQPPNTQEYQAFNPQGAPSPLLPNAPLHGQGGQGQDASQQQQDYYAYQHQQLPPQAQGQLAVDHAQQELHYHHQPQPQPQPQQQQFASQQQPRQGQDHPQQPQTVRPPPQQQIDAHQSQQLRPPSSSQQFSLPSPLQPQPYQTHDAQTSHQPYSSETQVHNITPPQQDNMASKGQSSNRNTLRNGGLPGAPSRESSLLQQPSAQASQGQPYRGEKQGQGELGRATPPPRSSATDMTEEEIEKMIKEHDVLREKYQKVKRYFFEQQTQVHQLQNTLANQRLSLSRTSWDDSEYSTRFNRLDGLIAQLSFSIRKDWKLIPQWLQIVVNKTAVETGKQEMTAVGRAFISHWLVENIFEKYFHPDLEPGFSTQLQSIASNIRKFSPPCHSVEDEESLAAKIINWRLATLEGLADTLRAPQAETYRQQLTNTLNEKLIASLQIHLNDPAPADLAGGVPMIIELAISIAQHLPLESREVHIEYFPPGHGIVAEFMKMESGIPALTAPIMELDEADRASLRSVASKVDDSVPLADQDQLVQPKEDKKRGMFSFGGSKKATAAPATLGKRESMLGQGGSQQSLTPNPPGSSHGPKDEPPAPRVRMAVGVAVQIRGKSILMKAPVYST